MARKAVITTMNKLKKTLSAVAVSLAAVSLTTGCVGKPASAYERNSAAQCPFEPSDVAGNVRLGYQIVPGNDLFIRNEGLLEACLPNVDVSWTRFPAGQDIVQGFAAGSADIGFVGLTPAAKALSAPLNLDVKVPQINVLNQESEALVAKHAKSIQELKGKKVATPFSSTSHYALLNALKQAGLDPKHDVEIVNISPDKLPAAWKSNEIEAAFIWNPTLAELQRTGTTLIDSGVLGKRGAPTFNATIVDRKWADKNPEILDTWLKLSHWAASEYRNNPNPYISANAAQTGMSFDETKKQLAAVHVVDSTEQEEQLKKAATALYNTAVFLQEQDDVKAFDQKHYEEATKG